MKYTYTHHYQAHYGNSVVIIPDQVIDLQREYAQADRSFPALRLDGSKVRVKIDAEATGLFTTGTGDPHVKSV